MEAAKERGLSVLMVTQDQKEDWWADRGLATMRARPELVSELLRFAGQQLLMMRSPDLVRMGDLLGVEISQSTLVDAELTTEDVEGWSARLADTYLNIISRWPEQYQVLLRALEVDGKITRDEMASILGKDALASMRGVGKPYYTALKRLTEAEGVDQELSVPLYAHYESGGWMSHFVMPEDIVSLFQAAAAQRQANG
jgi:hypothetical protein